MIYKTVNHIFENIVFILLFAITFLIASEYIHSQPDINHKIPHTKVNLKHRAGKKTLNPGMDSNLSKVPIIHSHFCIFH